MSPSMVCLLLHFQIYYRWGFASRNMLTGFAECHSWTLHSVLIQIGFYSKEKGGGLVFDICAFTISFDSYFDRNMKYF